MSGYIIISRKMLKNKTVMGSDRNARLWLWMICEANYLSNAFLKRGQLFTSHQKIAEILKQDMPRNKLRPTVKQVRKCLETFKQDKMIQITRKKRGIVITILNYDVYQKEIKAEQMENSTEQMENSTEQMANISENHQQNSSKNDPPENPSKTYKGNLNPYFKWHSKLGVIGQSKNGVIGQSRKSTNVSKNREFKNQKSIIGQSKNGVIGQSKNGDIGQSREKPIGQSRKSTNVSKNREFKNQKSIIGQSSEKPIRAIKNFLPYMQKEKRLRTSTSTSARACVRTRNNKSKEKEQITEKHDGQPGNENLKNQETRKPGNQENISVGHQENIFTGNQETISRKPASEETISAKNQETSKPGNQSKIKKFEFLEKNLEKNLIDEIYKSFHQACPMLPICSKSPTIDSAIKHLLCSWSQSESISWWNNYFKRVSQSDWLTGEISDFRADLYWLVNPDNISKVLSGRYDNRKKPHLDTMAKFKPMTINQALAIERQQRAQYLINLKNERLLTDGKHNERKG